MGIGGAGGRPEIQKMLNAPLAAAGNGAGDAAPPQQNWMRKRAVTLGLCEQEFRGLPPSIFLT